MPVFASPFSGLVNNRKLTDAEPIRAIRFAAAGEYEAAQTYMLPIHHIQQTALAACHN